MNRQRKILITVIYNDLGIIVDTKAEELDLSANLQQTCNQLATDCISRQQAIDAVDKRFDSIPMEQTTEILMLRKDLRELPSAQPEVLDCGSGELVKDSQRLVEASSNDMISRQQAIDAMKEHRALYCDNTPDTFSKLSYAEKSRVDELDTAIATLVNLPSAQPLIRTEMSLADLISRQQAIEAFEPEHHTDWYTPTIIKTLEELPQAQQDKSCKGCNFEKHGSRACDHCSRMYMDRYEVRNDD